MQQQVVTVARPLSSVGVKSHQKQRGVKVGRYGAVRIYRGGKRVQDRETILSMVGRKV